MTVMCDGNAKKERGTRSSPAGKTAVKKQSQLCFQVNPGMQYAKQHVFNRKSSKEKTISSSRLAASDEGHFNQKRNLLSRYLYRSSLSWFL